jgi:UDP-N-acetylmuramate dehydrogenase
MTIRWWQEFREGPALLTFPGFGPARTVRIFGWRIPMTAPGGLRSMAVPPPLPFERNVPLSDLTTFRIGGPADLLLLPQTIDEFVDGVRWCRREEIPLTVMGGGSNVLISDEGIRGAVMVTTRLTRLSGDGNWVVVESGATVDQFCEYCAGRKLAGAENFYGMPGTVGGAVFMNARCYERSMADILDSVVVVGPDGDSHEISAMDCLFSYKQSRFQDHREWIVSARFTLEVACDEGELRQSMATVRRKREQMGQYAFPNAGCVFKNDYDLGVPSGKIIEDCGLKGWQRGDARVYEKHANFVVNIGRATAADVLALIESVEAEVFRQKGVRLKRELRLLGFPDIPSES